MRKYVKILVLLMLIIMVAFTFSTKVNAAENIDYSGYQDLDGEDNQQADSQNENKAEANKENSDEDKKEDTEANKVEQPATETKNPANAATTNHPQTGDFINTVFIAIVGMAIVAIVIGYVKMKKYNY